MKNSGVGAGDTQVGDEKFVLILTGNVRERDILVERETDESG
jgi:hypothetical protein